MSLGDRQKACLLYVSSKKIFIGGVPGVIQDAYEIACTAKDKSRLAAAFGAVAGGAAGMSIGAEFDKFK